MVVAIALIEIDCWGDRLDIANYGDSDRLCGDDCWGDRLDIANYGNGDRLCGDDCWGDRLEITNYGDGDRLQEIDCRGDRLYSNINFIAELAPTRAMSLIQNRFKLLLRENLRSIRSTLTLNLSDKGLQMIVGTLQQISISTCTELFTHLANAE